MIFIIYYLTNFSWVTGHTNPSNPVTHEKTSFYLNPCGVLSLIIYGGCGTAMKGDYTDIVKQASQIVFEAIKDREENLSEQVKELDGELAKYLRLVGHQVMSMCLNEAALQVTNESKKKV